MSSVSSVSSVSGVSGVSDKFESKWLTVSRVSGVLSLEKSYPSFVSQNCNQRTRQHGNERRHDWSLPGLLRVDGAQMAAHRWAARTNWLEPPHGTAGDRRVEHRGSGASDEVAEPAAGPSRLGTKHALSGVEQRASLARTPVAQPLARGRLSRAGWADAPVSAPCGVAPREHESSIGGA